MKRNYIKIIGFLLLLALCGVGLARVLCFKYSSGIQQMEQFYNERRNSIDVLCLGSSHTFVNINTKTLWEQFGISSYDLCGSVQPLWNTFYYLKEALEYQNPKVVVLDVYCATLNVEYIDHSRIIKNTFGISSILNRINAIWKSSPKSQRLHYWLAYPTYHRRYENILKADFSPQYDPPQDVKVGGAFNDKVLSFSKGFLLFTRTNKQSVNNILTPKTIALSNKNEEYLRKIIGMCKERNIPLLLVVTPYAGDNTNDEGYYATVQGIATETGVPFVNFNHLRDEIGMDFSTDATDVAHLNYRGSDKFSRYLGKYLKSHYDLPDHRGEDGYVSYYEMCRVLQWIISNQEVQDTKELATFLDCVQKENDRYILIVGMQGNCQSLLQDVDICKKLEALGMTMENTIPNDVWVLDAGRECFHAGTQKRFDWHMLIKDGFVHVTRDALRQPINCNLNREQQSFVTQGLSVVVFDKELGRVIDRAGFHLQDGGIGAKKRLDKTAT